MYSSIDLLQTNMNKKIEIERCLENTVGGNGTFYFDAFVLILGIIAVSPSFIIGCISQKLYDTLGIRSQLRTVGISAYVILLTMIFNMVAVPFGAYRILFTYFIIGVGCMFVGIRMVYIKKLNEYLSRRRTRSRSRSDPNQPTAIKFNHIWGNKQLFQLFANHAVTEYSIETLLFILEYRQLKQLIIEHHEDLIQDINERKQFTEKMTKKQNLHDQDFEISEEILKIEALETNLTMIECIKSLQYLYDHYIDEDSLITVNISGILRRKIVRVFGKYHLIQNNNNNKKKAKTRKQILPLVVIHSYTAKDDIIGKDDEKSATSTSSPGNNALDRNISDMLSEILEIFEEAAADLFLLLYKDSWPRFKKTPEFAKFVKDNGDLD